MSDELGWDAFWELWESGRWEPETRQLIMDTLKPGDLFLDVGAWIGPTAKWALEAGAKVIAVEPDPIAAAMLLTSMPPARVDIWQGALTVGGGEVVLAPNPKDGGFFGDSMSRIGDLGINVDSWTLDQILGGRVPKMVKIDVEGYEVELAPHVLPILAEMRCTVQISCHGQLLDRELFDSWSDVTMPHDTWGDVVARP